MRLRTPRWQHEQRALERPGHRLGYFARIDRGEGVEALGHGSGLEAGEFTIRPFIQR